MQNLSYSELAGRQGVPAGSILQESVNRKAKFQTRTIIKKTLGKNMVYKCAATEQAKQFVRTIADSEKKNAEYLRGQFGVLGGVLQGNYIKYDYLPFPSLQDEMGRYLRQFKTERANELLREFVNRVKALKRVQVAPETFLKTLGASPNDNLCIDCLQRGLLDLKPSHVLINSDQWIVLDNEWSFDFPVPICFVLFRAIRETAYFLQWEIRESTGKASPAIGTFCLGFKKYYVPVDWMEHLLDAPVSLRRMLRWELGFQRYVTGKVYPWLSKPTICCALHRQIKKSPVRKGFLLRCSDKAKRIASTLKAKAK